MKPQPPLSIVLQSARMEMLKAANGVMQKFGVPPCLMDGILSGLLADVRAQSSSEIIRDLEQQSADIRAQSSSEIIRDLEQQSKEGESENE